MPKIDNGFLFNTAIVGESFYKSTISKCYRDKNNYRQNGRVFMKVSLKLEDDNPYDKNAVAIISKHGKVGHLPKALSERYRKDYNNTDGLTVQAKIYAKGLLFKNYGIWIDLDY